MRARFVDTPSLSSQDMFSVQLHQAYNKANVVRCRTQQLSSDGVTDQDKLQ